MSDPLHLSLRPYGREDFGLLKALLGDAEAMRYLGGAESEEQLSARHRRYLSLDPTTNWIYVIEAGGCPVGWIGMWCTDVGACEAGWHVLREARGRGIAGAALGLLIELARERASCDHLDAFPSVDNNASNALCRSAGFSDLGRIDVEYPKGHKMRSNHWRLDLHVG